MFRIIKANVELSGAVLRPCAVAGSASWGIRSFRLLLTACCLRLLVTQTLRQLILILTLKNLHNLKGVLVFFSVAFTSLYDGPEK